MPAVPQRQRILYLLVGLIVGAAATGLVWATNGGGEEVRVVARILDDGRVEVALQQRLAEQQAPGGTAGAEWSEIERPEQRFLAPSAERNRWFSSSPVRLQSALAASDQPTEGAPAGEAASAVVNIGPFAIVGLPTSNRAFDDSTLFCVVTHGTPSDFFWYQVYSAFADIAGWTQITLRAEMHELGADQAAAIDQCVADGAAAIATTLADPDALMGALERAETAGVRLLSFNSGADRSTEVGAAAHVGLDERAVGRMAAQEFTRREVSGDLLCVIHEPTNRGLEERCDSLEANYEGGEVVRLRLSESGDDDVTTIAAAATAEIGGAIALNANTAYDMAAAIAEQHPDIVLAAVTSDFPRPLAMLESDRLDFLLWSHALEQGYHTVAALLFAQGSPFPPQIGLFAEAVQISIQPSLIDAASVERLLQPENEFGARLPAWLEALKQAIETEQAEPSE